MNKLGLIIVASLLATTPALAHELYLKKNPTNEEGIVWGVDNASGFTRWRAYIKGLSNNSSGTNSGWSQAGDGWWYYDISSLSTRVLFHTSGLENQNFQITYWAFKSDGSWEFGSQATARQDNIAPTGSINSPVNGAQSSSPRISVISSDDNSLLWTRLYLWTPAGFDPSGWIYDGDNRYYKEFFAGNIDYTLGDAAVGDYVLTAWIKDSAGNVAKEPWGRVNFSVVSNTGSQDPPSPDNPPPPENSSGTGNVDPPVDNNPDYEIATIGSVHVRLPVDTLFIYSHEANNEMIDGMWYDYQPFGSLFNFQDKAHLGADLNKIGGDMGDPVYNISSDCEIHNWDDTNLKNEWGKWLMLNCHDSTKLGYVTPDGGRISDICALYAHLGEIKITQDDSTQILPDAFQKGMSLGQDWQIGTVGNANGYYISSNGVNLSHLHFEIRKGDNCEIGHAYHDPNDISFLDNYVDPVQFIEINHISSSTVYIVRAYPYQLNSTTKSSIELDQDRWVRQGRTTEDGKSSLGTANHLWLAKTNVYSEGAVNCEVPQSGSWELYVFIPRAYTSTSRAAYTLWHSDSKYSNPFRFELNQSGELGINEKKMIGVFYFNQKWRYSLVLNGNTAEPNPKTVALDAIELRYIGGKEIGGLSGSIDSDGDQIPDDWEILYSLDKYDLSDGLTDPDFDGLNNLSEYRLGALPNQFDSDGDGYSDGEEVGAGYDPTNFFECPTCSNVVAQPDPVEDSQPPVDQYQPPPDESGNNSGDYTTWPPPPPESSDNLLEENGDGDYRYYPPNNQDDGREDRSFGQSPQDDGQTQEAGGGCSVSPHQSLDYSYLLILVPFFIFKPRHRGVLH